MCLVCSDRIDDGVATPSDGVAFQCPAHGSYSIARSALPRFIGLTRDRRASAIERAKVFASKRNGEVIVTSMDI